MARLQQPLSKNSNAISEQVENKATSSKLESLKRVLASSDAALLEQVQDHKEHTDGSQKGQSQDKQMLLLSHKNFGAGSQAPVPVESKIETANISCNESAEHVDIMPPMAEPNSVSASAARSTAAGAVSGSTDDLGQKPRVMAEPVAGTLSDAVPEATMLHATPVENLQDDEELPGDFSAKLFSGLQHAFAQQFADADTANTSSAAATTTDSSASTTSAASEAAQLLKDLDVLKQVKEFNAKQHAVHDGDSTLDSSDEDFYQDYDYDESEDLSGMHVVHGSADDDDDDPSDHDLSFAHLNFSGDDSGYDYDDEDEVTVSTDPNNALLNAEDVDLSGDEVEAEVIDRDSALGSDFSYSHLADEPQATAVGSVEDASRISSSTSSSHALVRTGRGSSVGSTLGAMIKAAQREPMLSEEEEKELARRYKKNGDLNAAWRLVMSHMRLVMSVARKFTGYGMPLLDLIQEGNIGLMKAVKNFDPDAGVRLAAFAAHHIRSEIFEYVICNWRMVKVATTKSQRSIFFKLRQAKKHLGWMNEHEREQLANLLGVSAKEVAVMETRMAGSDIGFDLEDDDSEKGSPVTMSPSSYLEDENSNFSQVVESLDYARWEKQKLYEALATLDERAQYIMKRRWLDEEKATFQELSQELKISIERVRQLENNAMKKIKSVLLASGVNAADEAEAETSAVAALSDKDSARASVKGAGAGAGSELLRLPNLSRPALPYKKAQAKDESKSTAASTLKGKKSTKSKTRKSKADADGASTTSAADTSGTAAAQESAEKKTALKRKTRTKVSAERASSTVAAEPSAPVLEGAATLVSESAGALVGAK